MRILSSGRGKEKMQDELCYARRSASCDEENAKCRASESGRMKLFV